MAPNGIGFHIVFARYRIKAYDSTLIGALELSSKKWVFAVQLPGSKKHTRQVVIEV